MAEYATPNRAAQVDDEAPEDRLIRETHLRLKEAQEMASHFREQSKVMAMQAEQFERIAKASEAALNVLSPQEKTGSAVPIGYGKGDF
jgi:thiamine biosynthesis lipoprotein ApbE